MEQIKVVTKRIEGTSGTRLFGGFYLEEYLTQLNSQNKAYIFDKMRRQDPGIGQMINIMNNVISSLSYEIKIKETYKEVSEAEKQKDLISTILFENMYRAFGDVVREIATNNIYGYSLFEGLWKNESSNTFGQATVLKDLLWRSPKTIWEFRLDKDEQLDYIVQRAYGDSQKNDVKLPASNTFIFTNEKEGQNFEGISPLRRAYGPWQIKQMLLEILALGSEKFGIPTLFFESTMAGIQKELTEKLEESIINYVGGNNAYLVVPDKYKAFTPDFKFDPEKVVKSIEFCNSEMIKESSATFLEMQGGGSYALGSAMIKFFHQAVDSKAKIIAGPFNRRIIPALINFNRSNEPVMVELMFSAAGMNVSKEYSDSVSELTKTGILTPDDTLESFLRKNMHLPEIDKDTIRVKPADNPPNLEDEDDDDMDDELEDDDDDTDDNESMSKANFESSYKKAPVIMKNARRSLRLTIDRIIERESDTIIKTLVTMFQKAKTDSEKSVLPDFSINKSKLETEIYTELSSIYDQSTVNTKREISSISRIRGTKDPDSFGKVGKRYAKSESALLVKTLANTIEETLGGEYLSLFISVNDADNLERGLVKRSKKIRKHKSIVSTVWKSSSKTVNLARRDVFESMKQKIESYTYYNDVPVTALCTYLNGKTFKAGREKIPPFHWGCDGYLVPNLKEWKKNPKIDRIRISPKMKKGMEFLK